MKHERAFVTATIFLVFVISSLFITAGNTNAVTAVIYVDPPQLEVPANRHFTVNITVKDVADLYAWEFKLYYRNDVLSGTELIEGPFLKERGITFFYVVEFNDEYNGTHGRLWAVCTLTGMMAGQTGQGVLATAKFFAVASGVSPLSLRDTKLVLDPEPILIPHNSLDGTVTIGSALPPAVINVPDDYPTIQLAVDAASSGDIVLIARGTYCETVHIHKKILTLRGEKRETIIEGQGNGTVVNISAEKVCIAELTIRNGSYGIHLTESKDVVIQGNLVTYNEHGIFIQHSEKITIQENTVTNNGNGLLLLDSNNNSVYKNKIMSNNRGIFLGWSTNNTIYHNDIENNLKQLFIFQSINKWDNDYPSGGNHWSDYEGVDLYHGPGQDELGSDGIGDTPYIINADNKDRYPLIETVDPPDTSDIALIDIAHFPLSEVYEGNSVCIIVVVRNEGFESFNVTVYFNGTLIQTQTVTDSASSNEIAVTFWWDPVNVELYAPCTIWAEAAVLSGETNISNNVFTDGTLKVKIMADINGDALVNYMDSFEFSRAHGTEYGHPRYDPRCDFNQDGRIDYDDLFLLACNYGKTWVP